jgi:hydroxymethylpyrimidine/phosphomethylpyrimidine kinase
MGASQKAVEPPTRALTIAGSDSGGGAGIQADLKVFMALGCHGMSALTALTAQNTVGVSAIHEVPPDFVIAQIDAVASDIGVDATKIGMLSSAPIVEAVAKAIEVNELSPIVLDPVFVSKHRNRLLAEDAVEALVTRLFPLAELITPNLFEAEGLLGHPVRSLAGMKDAAHELASLGARAVLVKGGHLTGARAVDVLFDGDSLIELEGPRHDTEDTHGTGCALSSAITAFRARGEDLPTAVARAKEFVGGAIQRSLRLGRGYGPVNPAWRLPES